MDNCETCKKKPVRYRLKNEDKLYCPQCDHVKYTSLELNICDTKCSSLYWWPVECKYKKGSENVSVSFMLEKDECDNCGLRDFPVLVFKGTYTKN